MKNRLPDKVITVFTPAFNRKHLLTRCYESLCRQKNKNFIWLVIDDGSTDGTKELIDIYKVKSDFKIEYYYQINSGKYIAYNNAVKKCHTDYFMILDSDDVISEDAIDVLYRYIDIIDKKSDISGIIGNSGKLGTNEIIGNKIPNVEYTTGLELYQKYKFRGDTLRVYKTSILKNYLFPVIEKEKFIPENVVFDRIDINYNLLVIQEVLYFAEYQNEGYSSNIYKIRNKNPKGYACGLKVAAETAILIKKRINWTILYIIWCKSFKIKGYESFKLKAYYIILYPIALILKKLRKPKFLFKSIDYGDKNE